MNPATHTVTSQTVTSASEPPTTNTSEPPSQPPSATFTKSALNLQPRTSISHKPTLKPTLTRTRNPLATHTHSLKTLTTLTPKPSSQLSLCDHRVTQHRHDRTQHRVTQTLSRTCKANIHSKTEPFRSSTQTTATDPTNPTRTRASHLHPTRLRLPPSDPGRPPRASPSPLHLNLPLALSPVLPLSASFPFLFSPPDPLPSSLFLQMT